VSLLINHVARAARHFSTLQLQLFYHSIKSRDKVTRVSLHEVFHLGDFTLNGTNNNTATLTVTLLFETFLVKYSIIKLTMIFLHMN